MSIQLSTLDNGLRVVTHEMPDLQTASLSVYVDVGVRNETEREHGISHFLEHMAFKGTATRDARSIAEEIENVGGDLNAATSVESTVYYARVLKENTELGFDILSDILLNATMDETELEKEQHVVLQEIGAAHDTPDDMVYDHALEAAFPGQSIGRPILGTPETVNSFQPSDLNHYLKSHYRAPSMILAAAGGISHDEVMRLASQKFTHFDAAAGPERQTAKYIGGAFLDEKPLEQVHLVLGFEGVSYRDDDYYPAQILSGILGGGMSSRLFQEIREERGLCYAIYAFHWAFYDTGFFGVYGATSEEDCTELMPVILDTLKGAQREILEVELNKTKAQVKSALMMTLESSMARAEQMARQLQAFGRVRSNDEILDAVNSVTVQDIQRVAERVFTASPATLSAVGPIRGLMTVDEITKTMKA